MPTELSPGASSLSTRASTSEPAGCIPPAESTPSTSIWKRSRRKTIASSTNTATNSDLSPQSRSSSLTKPTTAQPKRSSPSTARTTAPSSVKQTENGSASASCRNPLKRSLSPTPAPRPKTTNPSAKLSNSKRTPPTTPSSPTLTATSPTSMATSSPAATPPSTSRNP